MNNLRALLIGVVLSLVFSACTPGSYQTPGELSYSMYRRNQGLDRGTNLASEVRLFEWVGTSRIAGVDEGIFVQYALSANDVTGTYFLGEQEGRYGHIETGRLEGFINSSNVLNVEVRRSSECVWKFTGVISDRKLQGRGLPTFCPGAEEFEWNLRPG